MLRRLNFLNSLTIVILVSAVWSGHALADVVPENLASMARSLLLGVEAELKQSSKDETHDAIRKRTRRILKQAGIRHWTRKPASQDETTTEPTQTYQMLVGDNEEQVELKWDRPSKKFTIRIKANETSSDAGNGFDLQLNGKVMPKPGGADGKTIMDVQPDERAISVLTGEELKTINASVVGSWRDQKGRIWEISAADGDSSDTVPVRQVEQQMEEVSRQIEAVKSDKVYYWKNLDTNEIVKRDNHKRPDGPYEFDRAEDRDPGAKERLAALENQLEQLRKKSKPLLADTDDPIGMKKMLADKRARKLNIQVTDKDNYSWTFDTAAQLNGRIKAKRTLRSVHDDFGLPDKVIRQLIASVFPPEWVELEIMIEHETREVSLAGLRWRLAVTYDGDNLRVKSLHTPYSAALTFERECTTEQKCPDLKVVEFTSEQKGDGSQHYWHVKATVENVGWELERDFSVHLSYSDILGPGANDWRPVTKSGDLGRPLKHGEKTIFEWRTDAKTADGELPKLPDSADKLKIEIDKNQKITEISERNNSQSLYKICKQPDYQSTLDDSATIQNHKNKDVEWGDSDDDKAMAVLCYIRDEAERRAKSNRGKATVATSSFFKLIEDEYLHDYINYPQISGLKVVDRIGAPLVSSETLGVRQLTMELFELMPITRPFRSRYNGVYLPIAMFSAMGILRHTPVKAGNYVRVPLGPSTSNIVIDVPFLLGKPRMTSDTSDYIHGGKNWTNVMHWATGVKYHALPDRAMRELFVLYEYWHMEGFDVFGEDAINDLIAEEQGRLFGKLLNDGKVRSKKSVIRAMDRQFQQSRAWVGAMIKYRQDHLDYLILERKAPKSDYHFKNRWQFVRPWGIEPTAKLSIKQQIAKDRSITSITASTLVQNLIEIYVLIYESEIWQKKHGNINLSNVNKTCLRGNYNNYWRTIQGDPGALRKWQP